MKVGCNLHLRFGLARTQIALVGVARYLLWGEHAHFDDANLGVGLGVGLSYAESRQSGVNLGGTSGQDQHRLDIYNFARQSIQRLGATGDINGCLQQLLSQLSSDPAPARLNDSDSGNNALLRVNGSSSRRAG